MRFPNESPEYRAARDELLAAEIELRRAVERVAAQRRSLPLGGEVKEDYVFTGAAGPVRMSELFTRHDTLLLYSLMYGPQMKAACPLCTSILDGLEGQHDHVTQRADLAVVARSPLPRLQAHAAARGWSRLRLVSDADNTYHRDYGAETEAGKQLPALNVFVRRDGRIHHFWNSELLYAPTDPGEDARHVDLVWPLWNLLDLTPEGRGDFRPRLEYS